MNDDSTNSHLKLHSTSRVTSCIFEMSFQHLHSHSQHHTISTPSDIIALGILTNHVHVLPTRSHSPLTRSFSLRCVLMDTCRTPVIRNRRSSRDRDHTLTACSPPRIGTPSQHQIYPSGWISSFVQTHHRDSPLNAGPFARVLRCVTPPHHRRGNQHHPLQSIPREWD